MSVFSEPREHRWISERLKDSKEVIILTCPFCASLSLAYINDIPVWRLSRHPTWTYGVLKEAEKLKERLEEEGRQVTVYGLSGAGTPFCTPGRLKRFLVRKRCRGADAVVVLSCAGGLAGVVRMLGRRCRVVHGMRSVGCGMFELRWNFPFEVVVKRDTARVVRFNR